MAVSKIDLRIIPDLMHNWLRHAPPTGSRLSGQVEADGLPDLLLGMDVLRHLHIYIAYKEEMLYVTPASSPAAETAQSAARPAGTSPN